ncbi:lariat debranching enzyme A-like [Sarcoptes scabiei]|uniref:DUF4078 domain containing protein n=1 Tax=Sarcoptes scabiei TaxID=52283 RepID=A0A132A984_SARSC|nr:DUF4078 domain containing protein [Sarcoptes scabiei]UXI16237.1 lariat debranching enzyme A-like [Sarcoptes scabiei]
MSNKLSNLDLISNESCSILNLKSELLRKQEQINQLKTRDSKKETVSSENNKNDDDYETLYSKLSSTKLPKKIIENLQQSKNSDEKIKKQSLNKIQNDLIKAENDELQRALEQSRCNLERKAQLYKQMCRGYIRFHDDDENCLVDFHRKNSTYDGDSESNDEDDEKDLVEYIDQFGRTRMVTKEQYEQLKQHEERNAKKNSDKYENGDDQDDDDDFRSEYQEPYFTNQPNTIHYEHVREGEIRDHGVAFYSFSQDEHERSEQMKMLRKIRDDTALERKKRQQLKDKQKLKLRKKLEKIASRRGVQLPEWKDDDDNNDKLDANEREKSESNVDDEIKLEHSKCDVDQSVPKSNRPREWDLGKEGVKSSSLYHSRREDKIDRSLKQQMKMLREERNPEFAPPSSYEKDHRSKRSQNRSLSDNYGTEKKKKSSDASQTDLSCLINNLGAKISEIRKKS